MPDNQKNLEKTLQQMSGNFLNMEPQQKYSPEKSSFKVSSPSFMTLVFIAEIILALVMAVVFYMKSSRPQEAKLKAPPGYEVVYPENAPPRLKPIQQ